jgi:hypothetical protein
MNVANLKTQMFLLLITVCGPFVLGAWQTQSQESSAKAETTSGHAWASLKTPWGGPDLQGTWTSDDTWGVPFERPAKFGTRRYLTEDEVKEREKSVQRSEEFVENGGGNTHSPALAAAEAVAKGAPLPPPPQGAFGGGVDSAPVPGHWGEFARRASRQTSQVIDPPDGKVPPLTPEAQQRLAARNAIRFRPPETWTDWSYYDRCITRGVAGSIIPVVYGNGLEIVQTPGYVAIRYEMVHDVRIIPTDGRPHLSSNIRSYLGDAVGHWEGNTLVVETTNLLGDRLAIGLNGDFGGPPYSDEMKLVERFTRTAPNTIDYQMTVNDPKTYTAPFTVAFPITHEPGYQLFEYACHEGNMAMRNMLSAARAAEAKKAAGGSQAK